MSHFSIAGARSRRMMVMTAGVVAVLSLFAQSALANNPPSPPPLNFFNNFFVTGDYVVGGVALRGAGVNGYATGTISIPDANSVPATGVPPGADIVAAYLYWQTVESALNKYAGQQGYFNGYAITGAVLGNPNTPQSWGLSFCTGWFPLFKAIRSYRADVRPYLRLDANGHVQGVVRLADTGSNWGVPPQTLGASLVIVYRVFSPAVPLKSIVLYDGAFAPIDDWHNMSQGIQGFYQAATSPVAKITHIVGNGQSNKFQKVYLLNDKTHVAVPLPSLYGTKPPFPGYYNSSNPTNSPTGKFYNGSWDNPTWVVNNYGPAVKAEDASDTTFVDPDCGCVSWSAVVFSTTVQNTDNDGLLNTWKTHHGYTDVKDGSWVDLTGATLGQKDLFIQADSMCSEVKADGTCDTANGHSHAPDPTAVAAMASAFSARGINLHFVPGNVIPETTCSDNFATSPPTLCPYPGQAGVVGWKGGFEFLKNQPINYPDEASCEAATSPACKRGFQHGKKDSYHYLLFGHSLGLANWTLQDGSLVSLVDAGNIATLTTLYPHKLTAGVDRVTVSDAISNPNLSGTYIVQSVTSDNGFTIQTKNVTDGSYTKTTDPSLSVSKGTAGTTSGYSDIGGSDSTVTLGGWGADGQSVAVQAGTMMHELGHTLALTHGGLYFDNPASSVATLGQNCKPNFQSVMNYLFQVDLLGPNSVLDYSGQELPPLDESTASPANVLASALYSTTTWYAPTQPVGTAATHHCDGSPLAGDLPTFRLAGPTDSIQWFAGQDINFDGIPNSSTATPLRGFNDWAHIDLRQIGATGNNIPGAGIFGVGGGIFGVGGGIFGVGGGIFGVGGGIFGVGGGIFGVGGGIFGVGGGLGSGEITVEVANSVVRPPRNLAPKPNDTLMAHSVELDWNAPSFGQIGSYDVYRGVNGAPPTLFYPTNSAALLTTTSFTDSAVSDCTTYTYFVSAILASDGRESVGSNSVQYAVPCPPTGLTASISVANNVASVTLNWTAASSASGPVYGYNVYRNSGTTPIATVQSPTTTFTDQGVNLNTTYTYYVTALLVDNTGCPANQHCRESSAATVAILQQTITFPPIPDMTYGNPDFTPNATASSGLAVSFAATGNCTVTGNMVHITGAGSCTVRASQAGNNIYEPAPDVSRSFNIAKANPTINVTGYSVTYDGNPHTATGSAKGVFNENLVGLDLTGTTHTNAGSYTDPWTFTDVTGNYNNANSTVSDSIAKANPTISVTPYSVTYDGNAHTATGTAKGVKGEALAGLNLSGTTHANAGNYADSWTFTDVTGNYNNANGPVADVIVKAGSTTTITSITPSPSILGQSFTVNFTVSPAIGGTPTGNVTVSDVSGANCVGALTGGTGKCVLTLPVLISGKAVVGTRTITATYPGDNNFFGSAGNKNQQVNFNFTGFLSPLAPAGDSSYSGIFGDDLITIKWQLTTSSGSYISDLKANKLGVYFSPLPANKVCPLPGAVPPGTNLISLYNPATGAVAQSSSFSYSTTSNQFVFKWNAEHFNTGCYVIELDLQDGQVKRTALRVVEE